MSEDTKELLLDIFWIGGEMLLWAAGTVAFFYLFIISPLASVGH